MEISSIIHKLLRKQPLSDEEKSVYDIWVSNPEHKKEAEAYEKLWDIVAPKEKLQPDIDKQWDRFKENRVKQVRLNTKKIIRNISAVAAVFVVVIGVSVLVKLNISSSEKYMAADSPVRIELSDGSEVILNTYSTLEVSKTFNEKTRSVTLSGEALFDVKRNATVPFIILLDNELNIKVLGTKFNVRNYETSQLSELKVISGKVMFQKNNEKVIVEKSQEVDFNHLQNTFTEKRTMNANLLAWYTKKFNFDNTPILEAVESLQRFINKEIHLPENCEELRYSGSFNNPTEKDIAEVLSLAMGWNYKITEQAIIFIPKK